MQHLFLIITFLAGSLCYGLQAQTRGGNYLSFDTQIDLPDVDHIELYAIDNTNIRLVFGETLSLIPPDMAKVDPDRILRVDTDTTAVASGPDKCLSTCLLDTLFVTRDLFLTDVEVKVSFFTDGTYEGESRMGWGMFNRIGNCNGPRPNAAGGAFLLIEAIDPDQLSFETRFEALVNLAPGVQSGFPFQQGDLEEIRLIRCNARAATQDRMDHLEELLNRQPLYCQSPSVDPQVPPAAALNRIQYPVTVRFFESVHAERAAALAESISYLFQIPMSDIFVEDMLPSYGGTPPVRDYLEVWIQ